MSEIRAVLFDVGGTLLYPDPPLETVYAEAAARGGLAPVEPAFMLRAFRAAFARQEEVDRRNGYLTDEARELARWKAIVADVLGPHTADTPLFDGLWEHFGRADRWRLFEDVPAALICLSDRGIPWALASNFDSRLLAICAGHPVLAACQDVFFSSRIGCRKPGRAFFAAIQNRLQLAPGQILLVGDDSENDYRGALAAGWQAVLVNRKACSLGENVGTFLRNVPRAPDV